MRDVNWYLLEDQNIQIYYDQNAYGMGRYALTAEEEAYPYLSSLLGVRIGYSVESTNLSLYNNYLVSNFPNIVLVLGDRVEGPGFANPVTENIEAQMIHPRSAAFFQHELVHRLMYEHNDLHIGAPGRLFSLAMMPTWWIEGLAEYLTESVGRVQIEGVMRSMSLQDNWPSWERMHALYNADGDTNLRGYVASGRFLGWIFSQSKEKNLFKIHEQLASKTITPFFYSASDNWLEEHLNKTGSQLYSQFKDVQKKNWDTYLDRMPKLMDAKIGDNLFTEEYTYKTYSNKTQTLISKMTTKNTAKKSSFDIYNEQNQSSTRNPISTFGTPLFALQNENNSFFVTSELVEFSNSSYGHNIKIISFKGNIFNLNDDNILSQTTIPFASKANPFVIEEIQRAGNGGFFIHASLRGNSFVYFFNANNNSLKKISELPFPIYPKFIGSNTQNCVISILYWDREQTSLEKICPDSTQTEIFPKNRLNIQDGYRIAENQFRLVVSWDKLLGIVDVSNQKITPVAAFPEWILEISDWGNDGKTFTAWVYENSKYKLFKFDTQKLKSNFAQWQVKVNKNSSFTKFPQYTPYVPPFKKIYSETKSSVSIAGAVTPAKAGAQKTTTIDQTKPQNDTMTNKKVAGIPAPYDHNFMFAFPYALPDILGGPSVNLVAIPYQDKMERDAIQIFGGYNFYLNAPSGTLSYINNRILDGFVTSIFAAPFFNGTYNKYDQGKDTKYYNYMLQEGVSFANLIKFRPTTFQLQQVLSLTKLEPYSALDTAPVYIGAQNTNLLSLTENLSFNLFKEGFYLAKNDDPTGRYMLWSTNFSLGGGKFNSLNGSTNSQGNSTGDIDYYNLNAAFLSSLSFHKQLITLTGKISTTQGPGTFNLKEYYSPYQTYILGGTQSLNYVSYPLLATSSLFNLNMGYWSGQSSLNYEFPILQNFESLFLMSYVNDWHGILSVNEGGVSPNTSGTNFTRLTTLSVGSSFTIDIKGFQIYPSLFYSQLLEENGWGVIMQVKLMNFM